MKTETESVNSLDSYHSIEEFLKVSEGTEFVNLRRVEPKPGPLLEAFSKPGSSGRGQLIINGDIVDITYLRLASPSRKNMLRIHFGNRIRDSRVIIDVHAGEFTLSVRIDEGEEFPNIGLATTQAELASCSINFAKAKDLKAAESGSKAPIPVTTFMLQSNSFPQERALKIIPIIPDNQTVILPLVRAGDLPHSVDTPLNEIALLSQTQVTDLLRELDPGLNVPSFPRSMQEYPDYEGIKLMPHSPLGLEIASLMKDWLMRI